MKISIRTAGRLLRRVEQEIRREISLWLPGAGGKAEAASGEASPSLPPRLAEYIAARQEKLERAYGDLESAQYGYCRSCQSVIAPERLKADPLVPTCASCARRNAL
jgi:RNA polymerase-binding transcription factor DksA